MQKVLMSRHRANWLLGSLEQDDFAYLEPYLELVTLSKRTVLYETGDTIEHTYFPHNSVVCLVNVMEDGHYVEVASFGREGMFGLLSALVSHKSFGRYVVQVPGTASRISLGQIELAIRARPGLQQLVLCYTEALLAQTFQIASCNAVHSVEARCCNWLISTRDRVDRDNLLLTHADLAEMLGVQRSTVSVVLRALQTAGLITQQRGSINIIDRAGLENVACECYAKIRYHFSKLLPDPFPRN